MPVAVRLRYVEDVYGKNAGAEQRDYYRQYTAAAAVILFSHLAGHHVPAAVQYGGYPDRRQLCGYPGAGGCGGNQLFCAAAGGAFCGPVQRRGGDYCPKLWRGGPR